MDAEQLKKNDVLNNTRLKITLDWESYYNKRGYFVPFVDVRPSLFGFMHDFGFVGQLSSYKFKRNNKYT